MTTKAVAADAAAALLVEHRSVSLNNVVVAVEAQVHSVGEEQRLHVLDQQVHHLIMIMMMATVMMVIVMIVMMIVMVIVMIMIVMVVMMIAMMMMMMMMMIMMILMIVMIVMIVIVIMIVMMMMMIVMMMAMMMKVVMMTSSGCTCLMHLLVHHITHLLVRGGRAAVVGVDVHGSMAAEDDPGSHATVYAL
jgi:MFS family permease